VSEITIIITSCPDTGMMVASWDDPRGDGGLTTQAENLSALESNIGEAIETHFEHEELPKLIRLHGARHHH
jgi:hypothetical protein